MLLTFSAAGAAGTTISDLPGSDGFPLVERSVVVNCPKEWVVSELSSAHVCVATTNDASGGKIVDAYKERLADRGFYFGRYFGSPSQVMLIRPKSEHCDLMIFGLPYLPPDQRQELILLFALSRVSLSGCARVEREGGCESDERCKLIE